MNAYERDRSLGVHQPLRLGVCGLRLAVRGTLRDAGRRLHPRSSRCSIVGAWARLQVGSRPRSTTRLPQLSRNTAPAATAALHRGAAWHHPAPRPARTLARVSATRSAACPGARRMSVSQTRTSVQPAASRARWFLQSRATLRCTLATQYVELWPRLSFARRFSRSRPCQKSPSQKTTTRSRGNTISGRPGNPEWWTR